MISPSPAVRWALLAALSLVACTSAPGPTSGKIRSPLDAIAPDGLAGPPEGLHSVDYEFCVPADPEILAAVQRIDPTVSFSESPGRVGCRAGQVRCQGNTHQRNWRDVLERLAARPEILVIQRCYFE